MLNKHAGFTTVEVLVVGALAVTSMVIVATLSLPMVAREAMTSAIYSVQNHLQLARVEAVTPVDIHFRARSGERSVVVVSPKPKPSQPPPP